MNLLFAQASVWFTHSDQLNAAKLVRHRSHIKITVRSRLGSYGEEVVIAAHKMTWKKTFLGMAFFCQDNLGKVSFCRLCIL